MQNYWNSILFLGLAFLLNGCNLSKTVNDRNNAEAYAWQLELLEPQYRIVHTSKAESELQFKLPILETQAELTQNSTATVQYQLTYLFREDAGRKPILDSSTFYIKEVVDIESQNYLEGSAPLKSPGSGNYYLEVYAQHLGQNRTFKTELYFLRNPKQGNQYYNLIGANERPTYNNYVRPNERRFITTKLNTDMLFVKYYNRDFDLALPPFATYNPKPFDYTPDSSFTISKSEEQFDFSTIGPGFYHLQNDTNNRDGLTIFCAGGNFPLVGEAEEYIEPLRFLSTKREYRILKNAEDKNAAWREFWANKNDDADKIQKQIEAYYSRVEHANKYFSSYNLGWKTDRGMVYLIYGAPNIAYKSLRGETWIYGEEDGANSLTFNFSRVLNPFSDNDFRLERSISFKNGWYRAVDAWRQGRIVGSLDVQ